MCTGSSLKYRGLGVSLKADVCTGQSDMTDNAAFQQECSDIPASTEANSIPKSNSKSISLKRRSYTQVELNEIYPDTTVDPTIKEHVRNACKCSKERSLAAFLSFFPIINVIRRYRRQYIVDDLLSGLSVSFLHLPQGLGFGLLASLAPINGLYTSFFPIVLGTLFGTSHHASLGTNAVIALLTAEVVEQEAETLQTSLANSTSITDAEILNYKVGVAMAAAFLAGLILLAMGILRLGFITTYLSVSFVGGFTTASAVHIFTSQISKALNIKLKTWSGAGKIVFIYIDIFTNIAKTNVADLIIALITGVVLLAVKIGINERFAKKLKIPIPIDLLVVVVGTLISHFVGFHEKYGVAIAKEVPTGLPVPTLPNMEVIPNIASQAFVMAIIVFAMTISLAKLMAKTHDYEINDNQELIAYGISNLGSSFFACFPACAAPPRVMILSSLRAKTMLNGVPSAIFILIILLVAGQLFVSLPIAVLAAMIMVAMKNLLLQLRQLPQIWRTSRADFAIWIFTFLVGVFADLVYGIIVGIGVSLLAVVIHTQLASGSVSHMSSKEDIITRERRHKLYKDIPGVRVFYFNSMLFFANAEKFKSELYDKVFHPATRENISKEILVAETATEDNGDVKSDVVISDNSDIRHIVIDCSAMSFVDIAGINVLKTVVVKYLQVDTVVYLASCRHYMLTTLDNSDFYDTLPRHHVFYDVWDALAAIESSQVINATNGAGQTQMNRL